MPDTPFISVIMPVHNGGKYLRSAVTSILQQSHRDFELIIVDDHSTDNAISELQVHDERVKLLSANKGGVVPAMNHGTAQAKGR